ncbi:hypothetical protein [Fusobacterium ulcerans]|uniref:hypothetical protein n=1 Tax=Fusobacterium ulcerans TaxID=861 RepID=UPI001032EB25|nr:hypothetical protein [Fusobacterium ulcerans]
MASSLNKNKVESVEGNDKYSVLDKDNAFDFPKDDGKRIEIIDSANEKKIIPEYYEPLNSIPPKYKNPPSYEEGMKKKEKEVLKELDKIIADVESDIKKIEKESINNLTKEIKGMKKDLAILEKVKKITGGDLGFNTTIEQFKKEMQQKKKEVNKLKKEQLDNLTEKEKKEYMKLSKKLDSLSKEQERLTSKGTLTDWDRTKLNKIEVELRDTLTSMKDMDSKMNPQDISIPLRTEDIYATVDKNNKDNQTEDIYASIENIQSSVGKNNEGENAPPLPPRTNEIENSKKESSSVFDKIKSLFTKKQNKDDNKVILRTEEEIKKKMDIVLNSGKNIPKEHLQDFLAKMLLNKDALEIQKKINSGEIGTEHKIIKNETIKAETTEDNIRLHKFYQQLENKFAKTREKIDNKVVRDLSTNKEFSDLILGEMQRNPQKQEEFYNIYKNSPEEAIKLLENGHFMEDSLNEEFIAKLLDIVQNSKKQAFEQYTGEQYKNVELKFVNAPSELYDGYYNREGAIVINLESKNLSISELLSVLLHETTHREQELIINGTSEKISEEIREYYAINSHTGGYINPNHNPNDLFEYNMYAKQPIEKEAKETMRGSEILSRIIAKKFENFK